MADLRTTLAVGDANGRPRSLFELGLRGPTLGVLQRQGVVAVDQLVEMSPEHLMGLRRVGLSRMLEVRKALQSHGLDLQIANEEGQPRTWAVVRRVRLICCDRGECSLEIRSAGALLDQTDTAIQAFIDAHRECGMLDGSLPIAGKVESSHSLTP
jgi:hypothetical protein